MLTKGLNCYIGWAHLLTLLVNGVIIIQTGLYWLTEWASAPVNICVMSDTMIYSCAYDDCEMRPKLSHFKHFYFTVTVMLSNHNIYTIIQYQTNYNWIGVKITLLLCFMLFAINWEVHGSDNASERRAPRLLLSLQVSVVYQAE